MYLVERLWAVVTSVLSIVSLSPVQNGIDSQQPLQVLSELPLELAPEVTPEVTSHEPFFSPPGTVGDEFKCDYTQHMPEWEFCSTPTDRRCWLRRNSDGKQYDINTNYEEDMPIGITRNYDITLHNGTYDADGMKFEAAKLFNGKYPGPWIEACWGDTIRVNVTNKLIHNGTSIHWHGIRQNQTMHMDGVNGITQCPIAPNDSFVYEFKVTQYGSSWYHSHYSVQYADGAVGPMTLHGPSSAEWDEAISPPLIMTDWGHNTAFKAVTTSLLYPDILLNGQGNVTNFNSSVPSTTRIEPPYSITFQTPQKGHRITRYLLRLINTSFGSTFIFSIDNHRLQIISTDFVPIQPYYNTSVTVGIGQRYHVIVEANPLVYDETSPLPEDGNYWMRTFVAPCGLSKTGTENYERTGILRYNSSSKAIPSSHKWPNIATGCADEKYQTLFPILQWQVKDPRSAKDLSSAKSHRKDYDLWREGSYTNMPYPLAKWSLEEEKVFMSMRVDYSDPTFLLLDNKDGWNPLRRIVVENFTSKDWVYIGLKGHEGQVSAHPIHLHGHDFALLEQAYDKKFDPLNLNLKLNNPPRRDVVLLPSNGYVVIAFKTDNPGAWLLHCHIAFHISEGLGFQILERQDDAEKLWPKGNSPQIDEAERVCRNWKDWQSKRDNWAVSPANCTEEKDEFCFQDDSGV